jgi:hypothetical protein
MEMCRQMMGQAGMMSGGMGPGMMGGGMRLSLVGRTYPHHLTVFRTPARSLSTVELDTN